MPAQEMPQLVSGSREEPLRWRGLARALRARMLCLRESQRRRGEWLPMVLARSVDTAALPWMLAQSVHTAALPWMLAQSVYAAALPWVVAEQCRAPESRCHPRADDRRTARPVAPERWSPSGWNDAPIPHYFEQAVSSSQCLKA